MTSCTRLSLGWKLYAFFINWREVWISLWGMFHISCLNNVYRMIAYTERCRICDLWRRFSSGIRDQASSLKRFCVAEFYYKKGTDIPSDTDIRRGKKSAHLASLRKGSYILFQFVITIFGYYNNYHIAIIGYCTTSKECLKIVKFLPGSLPHLTF